VGGGIANPQLIAAKLQIALPFGQRPLVRLNWVQQPVLMNQRGLPSNINLILTRAHKKFFLEKKCHFATCPLFMGAEAVALWWH
jgi:hypothetical protein